jgi:hypothetical protein
VSLGADKGDVSDDDPRWDFMVQKAAQVVLNTLIFHHTAPLIFRGGVITRCLFLLERIKFIMQKRLEMFPLPERVPVEKEDQSALFSCAGSFLVDIV